MKINSLYITSAILFFCLQGCGQQTGSNARVDDPEKTIVRRNSDRVVGGACDNCDMMYEGMPAPEKMTAKFVVPADEPGERMEISGSVVQVDGSTPAAGVILYIYHTDTKGFYSPAGNQTAGRRNGHLRGWAKSDAAGKFSIQTIRPAPYPNADIPAHIHIIVKEPGKTRYYVDEVWFADDAFVTPELRKRSEQRGGNLIIPVVKDGSQTWRGRLQITLGKNIPGYR